MQTIFILKNSFTIVFYFLLSANLVLLKSAANLGKCSFFILLNFWIQRLCDLFLTDITRPAVCNFLILIWGFLNARPSSQVYLQVPSSVIKDANSSNSMTWSDCDSIWFLSQAVPQSFEDWPYLTSIDSAIQISIFRFASWPIFIYSPIFTYFTSDSGFLPVFTRDSEYNHFSILFLINIIQFYHSTSLRFIGSAAICY